MADVDGPGYEVSAAKIGRILGADVHFTTFKSSIRRGYQKILQPTYYLSLKNVVSFKIELLVRNSIQCLKNLALQSQRVKNSHQQGPGKNSIAEIVKNEGCLSFLANIIDVDHSCHLPVGWTCVVVNNPRVTRGLGSDLQTHFSDSLMLSWTCCLGIELTQLGSIANQNSNMEYSEDLMFFT